MSQAEAFCDAAKPSRRCVLALRSNGRSVLLGMMVWVSEVVGGSMVDRGARRMCWVRGRLK